jgi:hypothetical protein
MAVPALCHDLHRYDRLEDHAIAAELARFVGKLLLKAANLAGAE